MKTLVLILAACAWVSAQPTKIDWNELKNVPSTFNAGQIQGRAVVTTAPTNGQYIGWDNAGTQWKPMTVPSAIITSVFGRTGAVVAVSGDYSFSLISGTVASGQLPAAGGDISGTLVAATVAALQGRLIDSTAPTDLQYLGWNATSSKWEPKTFVGTSQWSDGTGGAIYYSGGRVGIGTATPNYNLEISNGGLYGIANSQYSNDSLPAGQWLIKYRGSVGSPAIVQNGDYLGAIYFSGYGTTIDARAAVIAHVNGTVTGNNVPTDLLLQTTDTSIATTRLQIKSSGEVIFSGLTGGSGALACLGSDGHIYRQDTSCAPSGTVPISALVDALGTNSTSNGDYTQTINFNLVSTSNVGLVIGESAASTGPGSLLFKINTASGSTAKPFRATVAGSDGVEMDTTGALSPVGAGVINANKYNGNTVIGVPDGGTGSGANTIHGILVGAGTSPIVVLSPAADSLPLWQSSSADPTATAVPDCGDATHALAYARSTHTFGCQALSGSAAALSAITAAVAGNTIANGNNAQNWQFALTTNGRVGMRISESTAGSSVSAFQFGVDTLSGSTSLPVRFTAQGTTDGVEMTTNAVFTTIGTGVINANQYFGASEPAVSHGGTGATTASGARTNLGVPNETAYFLVGKSTNMPSNGIDMSLLSNGIVKIAISAGTASFSTAGSGTDYAPATSGSVPLRGNGSGGFSAAVAADIYGLWSGSCSSSTFLRGDGACAVASGSGTVNSGTATHLAYYAGSGTAVSDMGGDFTFVTHTLTGGSSSILDLSAASVTAGLKIPTATGASPTADGVIAVNSANHTITWGSNGSTITGVGLENNQTITGTKTFTADLLFSASSLYSVGSTTHPTASIFATGIVANGLSNPAVWGQSPADFTGGSVFVTGYFTAGDLTNDAVNTGPLMRFHLNNSDTYEDTPIALLGAVKVPANASLAETDAVAGVIYNYQGGTQSTTLTAAITTTTSPVTFTVTADVFPAVPFAVSIGGSEMMRVTSKSGTTFTATRPMYHTTAATHINGSTVTLYANNAVALSGFAGGRADNARQFAGNLLCSDWDPVTNTHWSNNICIGIEFDFNMAASDFNVTGVSFGGASQHQTTGESDVIRILALGAGIPWGLGIWSFIGATEVSIRVEATAATSAGSQPFYQVARDAGGAPLNFLQYIDMNGNAVLGSDVAVFMQAGGGNIASFSSNGFNIQSGKWLNFAGASSIIPPAGTALDGTFTCPGGQSMYSVTGSWGILTGYACR